MRHNYFRLACHRWPDALLNGQLACSVTLTALTPKVRKSSDIKSTAELLTVRVYRWIALKELRGKTAIQAEVGEWDVDSLGDDLKLMKQVLLDEPGAIDFAKNLAANESADAGVIRSWPLLDDFWKEIDHS